MTDPIYEGPIDDLIDGPGAFEDGVKAGVARAAKLLDVSAAAIRLHVGEMSAQEMRSVRAVLRWKKTEIENLIKTPPIELPG